MYGLDDFLMFQSSDEVYDDKPEYCGGCGFILSKNKPCCNYDYPKYIDLESDYWVEEIQKPVSKPDGKEEK